MISINSEAELRSAFRPIDQDGLIVPTELKFPLVVKDYHAWPEPGGRHVFLVFQDPGGSGARGVAFKKGAGSGEPVAQMCQWCHSVRSGGAVGLMTAKVSPKHIVGLQLCSDLSCKEKVLGLPNVNDLREPFSSYEKLYRVLLNMSDFARQNLF